jgi:hypothetical protein
LKEGLRIQGTDITGRLLNQSIDYFQKGLYNFVAHYLLAHRGLETWARVTNYYSSFFSIHALLCLQGQTITRLTLGGQEIRCHIIPMNLTKHEYAFSTSGLGRAAEHKTAWQRYYTIYDRYSYPTNQFEIVYKKAHVTDPSDESDQRNRINYSPFIGFVEMIDKIIMQDFTTLYIASLSNPAPGGPLASYLATLQALATDPDFQYFARSALRLLFIADILKRLISGNATLNTEWGLRLPLWGQFAQTVFSDPPKNFFESFPAMLS